MSKPKSKMRNSTSSPASKPRPQQKTSKPSCKKKTPRAKSTPPITSFFSKKLPNQEIHPASTQASPPSPLSSTNEHYPHLPNTTFPIETQALNPTQAPCTNTVGQKSCIPDTHTSPPPRLVTRSPMSPLHVR